MIDKIFEENTNKTTFYDLKEIVKLLLKILINFKKLNNIYMFVKKNMKYILFIFV